MLDLPLRDVLERVGLAAPAAFSAARASSAHWNPAPRELPAGAPGELVTAHDVLDGEELCPRVVVGQAELSDQAPGLGGDLSE